MSSSTSSSSDSDYIGNKLLIFTAIFLPLQFVCVALRYLSRYLIQGPWGLDDAVVMTSLILQTCMAALSIGSVKNAGVGFHIPYLEAVEPEKVIVWGKYLVAISTLYFASVNVPKLAILALYRRLFPTKTIRMAVNILTGALIALTFSTTVTALAACRPYSANWNPKEPGAYCMDKEAFFRYGSIPNIITDIIMLIIPVRVVWNLHTSTRLKIGLTLTFLVGSFGLITSVVRFAQFFKRNSFEDGTYNGVDLIIWTQVETGVYLISACLMTYRPLLERIGRKDVVSKLKQNILSKDSETGNSSKERKEEIALQAREESGTRGFRRLEDDPQWDPQILVTTNIEVAKPDGKGHGTHGM